jgi:O-antigen ligase
VFAGSPLLGVSPGHYLLTWNDPTLGPRFIYYAHDEYLQLAGELGLIGVAVAGVAAFAIGRRAWRSRSRTAAWAGPAAALLALAIHSGFDFLWHIPLIVVLMGVLIGLVTSPDPTSPVPISPVPITHIPIPISKETVS